MWMPINIIVLKTDLLDFSKKDKGGVVYPNWDPLIICTKIMGVFIHQFMVDNGVFYNIIFKKTLDLLGNFTNYIEPCDLAIRGFRNQPVQPYGMILRAVEVMSSLGKEV